MLFAIYIPVILDEEKFLRQKFPGFDEYARRVPRMFPSPISPPHSSSHSPSGFSLVLYLKHREYNALLGAMGMVAALIARMMLFH